MPQLDVGRRLTQHQPVPGGDENKKRGQPRPSREADGCSRPSGSRSALALLELHGSCMGIGWGWHGDGMGMPGLGVA